MISECFRIRDAAFDQDTPTTNAQIEETERLRMVLSRQVHAFSILNELQQIGAIEDLVCCIARAPETESDPLGPKWRAALSLQIPRRNEKVTTEFTEESKATAKRCASEVVVQQLKKRKLYFELPLLMTDDLHSVWIFRLDVITEYHRITA